MKNQIRTAYLIPAWSDYDVYQSIVNGNAFSDAQSNISSGSSGRFKSEVMDRLKGSIGEKANFFFEAAVKKAASQPENKQAQALEESLAAVKKSFDSISAHPTFTVLSSVNISGGKFFSLVNDMLQQVKIDAFTKELLDKFLTSSTENIRDFTKVVKRVIDAYQLQYESTETATIKVGRPLSQNERSELYFALTTSWGLSQVQIKEEVDPSVLGMELTVGNRNVRIDAKDEIKEYITRAGRSEFDRYNRRVDALLNAFQLPVTSNTVGPGLFDETPNISELKVDKIEEFNKGLPL